MRTTMRWLASLVLWTACTAEPAAAPEPVFAASVASWQQGRACMLSHEHELRYVRVVVDAAAAIPYAMLAPEHPYPVGATLVKLEYDDPGCTALLGYTAMQKQAAGSAPLANDWRWQRVDAKRRVLEDGAPNSCVNCHRHHCEEPECGFPKCGFDLTCGLEP
jgi:hypothetical protein